MLCDSRCAQNCLGKLGEANCLDIFTQFYNIPAKNDQDIYLQGLIDVHDVKQRHPRNDSPRINTASFKYHVLNGSKREKVCFDAFLCVFSISVKRVRRLRALKMAGQTPEDKRGRHISHSLPTTVHDLVRNHISSFPLKECHYVGGPTQYYLSADLSIKLMWKMFLEKHPQEKVSYYFYWTFFRDNFNYKFGGPQVDTCCTCEELNVQIKSP